VPRPPDCRLGRRFDGTTTRREASEPPAVVRLEFMRKVESPPRLDQLLATSGEGSAGMAPSHEVPDRLER